jgi:hypothetical protein
VKNVCEDGADQYNRDDSSLELKMSIHDAKLTIKERKTREKERKSEEV